MNEFHVILLQEYIGNNFTTKIYWNWFYCKSEVDRILLDRYIEIDFIIGIYWK